MEIWAKITSELDSHVYIKELPKGIQWSYILNVGDSIEIAGNNYTVSRRLINSYADTSKSLPFVHLVLTPIILESSVNYYPKLYAYVAINFFMGERLDWCKDKCTTIKNKEVEISNFITSVMPNSENDFIKVQNGESKPGNDLYCRFVNISNFNAGKNSVVNVSDEKIRREDLLAWN